MGNCAICHDQLKWSARFLGKEFCDDCEKRFPEIIADLRAGIRKDLTNRGGHIFTRAIALSAFRPGEPINNPNMFWGRKEQVGELVDAFHRFPLTGILGERGYGKTSTALMLQKLLRGTPSLRERYVAVQRSVRTVRIRCFEGLGRFLINAASGLLPERFPSMIDSVEAERRIRVSLKFFGITYEVGTVVHDRWKKMKEDIEKQSAENPRESFTKVVELINAFGQRVVVFLDEADRMTSEEMSKLSLFIKDCETLEISFCICGILESLSRIYAAHPSLGRAYREVHLQLFSEDEVNEIFEWVNQKLSRYVIFPDEVVQQILRISRGIPPIVQSLGYQSLMKTIGDNWVEFADHTRSHGPTYVSSETVDRVVEKSSLWFPNQSREVERLERSGQDYLTVLELIASCDDFCIEDDRLREKCRDLGISQKTLNSLLEPPDLRVLKRVQGYGGTCLIRFDDPCLAWSILNRRGVHQI